MYPKSISVLLAFAFCLQSIYAQVCSDPLNVIYGLGQNGDILPINVNNQSVGSTLAGSGSTGYPGSTSNANAIGLNIQTGTFYYFQKNVYNAQQFVSFNAATNKYTVLATSPITGSVVKGCITPDGKGYYCIDGNGILCYYNITSNTWTVISSTLKDQFNNNLASTFTSLGSGDIAIDGIGNMWIIVSSPTQWGLYELKAPLPVVATATVHLTEMIKPNQATPGGIQFAGIAYNATGQIYLSTANDLYLLQSDLSITHEGAFSVAGAGADLTSCNYPIDVLPVSWAGFAVSLQSDNSILLTWSVNQEVNNKGYNIEHSSDGKNWKVISYLATKHEKGTANYVFNHTHADPGVNYYRIQLSGVDCQLSYSEIKKIIVEDNTSISIWPIPAGSTIHIKMSGNANSKLIILNASGQMAATGLLHGGENAIDINSFAEGNYIVYIALSNGVIYHQKFTRL